MGDEEPPRFELKPGRYATRSLDHGGKAITIARQRRLESAPDPDPGDLDITGRYEAESGEFTIAINQAGSHIECWVGEVLTASDQRPKKIFRLGGDQTGPYEFTVYSYPDPKQVQGSIVVDGSDLSMRLAAAGASETARLLQNSDRATLSDALLRVLAGAPPIFAAQEWFPLTRRAQAYLRDQLSVARLGPLLDAFFEVGSSSDVAARLHRAERARDIDAHLAVVFATDPPEGWHKQDVPSVRHYARWLLLGQKYMHETSSRSLYAWISLVATTAHLERFGDANHMPTAAAELGISPADREPFLYKATLVVGGLAGDVGIVGAGGFTGGLTIEKYSSADEATATLLWRRDYGVWFGGISGGVSVGIQLGFYTEGQAISPLDHGPGDIPGWMSLTSLDGPRGGVGLGGTPYGGTVMILEGTGAQPRLAIEFIGWTADSSVGGGLFEVGMNFGRVYTSAKELEVKEHQISHESDYTVEMEANAVAHFHLGDAVLTPDARQLLRVFCAAELASIESPGSRLSINGYADRLDTRERNLELSRLRAKNVLTALRDVLGKRFGLGDDRVVVQGLGERGAIAAGSADETPDPNFRKVELILNSRLVATLRGR